VELLKRGEVKKTYKTDEVGSVALEILERERNFLGLYGERIATKMLHGDATSITMEYVGPQATFIPEAELQSILQWLRLHQVIHRDIRPENIVWDGKKVYLIDFAWAVRNGEQTNYSHDVGGTYKAPWGFDDEYSLRKIQHDLWHV
jgi:serine/threonine protein kinase